MQLRLIRLNLLNLLLVTLINVEAAEKLSRVAPLTPTPIAMPFQQVSSSSWASDEKVFESPKIDGSVAQIDLENRKTNYRRDTAGDPNEKTNSEAIASSPDHSETFLAQKLAQDALRSKEIQDKIKELTFLNGDDKKHQEISKETQTTFQPTLTSHSPSNSAKTTIKSEARSRHKIQGNRKHNRHRKRGRKHRHPKHRSKRYRLKKESSKTRKRKSRKSLDRRRRRGFKAKCHSEESVTGRRKRSGQVEKMRKKINRTSGENLELLMNDDQKSIEELSSFESTHGKYRRTPMLPETDKKGDIVHRKRSHMIAQLMRTTTRDPTKKKPGDQGIEYSEYYSDDDNISSPDIRAQSKLDESESLIKGGFVGESVSAKEDLLDKNYYDLSGEHQLDDDDDGERSKRNDEKFVKVMEQPPNSMEYVDNTYRPVQINGIVDNEKISPYFNNFHYNSDQGTQRQDIENHLLSYPSLEVPGLRLPASEQYSSDLHAISDQNLPMIQSLSNKVPLDIIPSMATGFNGNPMMNNGESFVLGKPGLQKNIVVSQLPQPRFVGGNQPYYSIGEMTAEHSTSSLTNPVAFSMSTSNGLETEILPKLYTASSFGISSGFSAFDPRIPIDSLAVNNGHFRPEVPGKELASTKASLATFKLTSSPTDISPVPLDSPDLFSRLQDIRQKMGAPEVKYWNDNDDATNILGPDQIEPIASRGTAMEGPTVKKAKKKGSSSTKKDGQKSTTASEKNDVKKHSAAKASKGAEHNLSPTTSCQTSVTFVASSTSAPVNTTLMANGTKAVANEILNEIIDELEELRLENPKNEQREGLPCKLTGSWVTVRAGVRIDMAVTNHSVKVSLDHLTSPISTDGLLNVTWNVTGFAPFKRGGPFTLIATDNHTKTLAVFVGACKVCQGVDTIEGSWTVSREPRDCRDFQMSTDSFNEIFRRTRLFSAIKDKQSKHEIQALSTMANTISISSTSVSTSTVLDQSEKSRNQTSESNGAE